MVLKNEIEIKIESEKLKKEVLNDLEDGAKLAAGFVVHDARKRLQAIQEPKHGRKYRRIIVASLLDFLIKKTKESLIIFVGVKQTAESKHHGLYIEVGSKTAKAQPFLRPAVFNNKKRIMGLITK